MRLAAILIVALSGSCAEAKPRARVTPVRAEEKKPKAPEYVDGRDAAAAMEAFYALKAAEFRWRAARQALIDKYGIDPERGDGWDDEPDGKLKIRKLPPEGEKR